MKDTQVNIRLTEHAKQQLEEKANRVEISISEYIRRLIDKDLNTNEFQVNDFEHSNPKIVFKHLEFALSELPKKMELFPNMNLKLDVEFVYKKQPKIENINKSETVLLNGWVVETNDVVFR